MDSFYEYLSSLVGILIGVLALIFALAYTDITAKQLHHDCVEKAIQKFSAPEVLAVCGK